MLMFLIAIEISCTARCFYSTVVGISCIQQVILDYCYEALLVQSEFMILAVCLVGMVHTI